MPKFTYKDWLSKLEEFNSRKFRDNLAKNKQAITEGIMPGSISSWMDLSKQHWHLSKYKPLSTRFEPDWFRPAAIHQKEFGVYTKAPYGSMAYREYWDEEYNRCQTGYETNGFRCPGEMYYWLNYYVLPVRTKDELGNVTEIIGHPLFLEFHYAWFHYAEWAWRREEDAVGLKPRGCGFSEVAASMATNTFTTKRRGKVMLCASFDGYLTGGDGVMDKANTQLDWLNANTQRGMKKLRQVSDTKDVKTSGTKDKEGTASGWLSTIMAKVIDKPDKLRGSRCRYVLMEEAGSFKGLQKAITAARGLVKTGGLRMGTIIIWGTGGDEGADGKNIEGLMNAFYHPAALGMLGLLSPFTPDDQIQLQGFFFPTYMVSFVNFDKHGVVDGPKVLQDEVKIRYNLELSGNLKGLIDHCAEYPFFPAEAFSQAGTNTFDRIKLEACKRNIQSASGIPKVRKGELQWIKGDNGKITGVKFVDIDNGLVEIIEEPERDKQGKVYKNLYIGGVDSIDYGTDNSAIGEAGSKFAIAIKKKYLSSEKTNNIYVAKYIERPKDERQAYERALKLAIYYNARLNVERTRKEVISYFRQRKMLRFIAKEVSIVTSAVNPAKAKKRMAVEGTTINPRTIQIYINLVNEYILDYGENIFFMDMIDYLINFSYELKSKFDLVVAMGMCELLDEDDAALNVVVQKPRAKPTKQLFGHYRDENGYKRYGKIPDKHNNSAEELYEKLGISPDKTMAEPDFVEASPFVWQSSEENNDGFVFEL